MTKPTGTRTSIHEDQALLVADAAYGGELDPAEVVSEVIQAIREGLEAGEDEESLVRRVAPDLERLVARRGAAATLGRLGGRARAAKLSPKRRAEIARVAAAARWGRSGESRK